MATNLTPEELAQLQALIQAGSNTGSSGWSPNQQWNGGMVDGNYWIPTYTGGSTGGEASYGQAPSLTGYMHDVVAGHHAVGDMQDMYDTQGNYLGTKAIPKTDPIGQFVIPALLGGVGLGVGTGFLGGPASVGAGAADAGVGAAVDPMMYGGTGAADWGAGAAAGGAGSGGYTLGSDLFPPPDLSGITGPIPGLSDLTPIGAGAGAAAGGAAGASAGGAGAAGAGAAGAGAAGSGLGGLGGLLGPAATIGGAIAGGQGNDQTTTTNRDIPDWLKPYVVGSQGSPGLLGYTQQLLDKQMQPGYMAGYDRMRTVGQGLLGTPQRGNGFSMFFPQFNQGQQ